MRQTGRILNIADDKVERFVRLCPEYSFFKCGFISSCTRDEKIRTATEEDQELDQLFQVSKILDGLPCMASSLPYEIVVTPSPASDFFPIKRKGGLGIIQYNFGCVQQAGIPTFPLSGWKDLDVIERLVRSKRIDISRIPENDEATFNLIASGDTRGIFQLDSPGMRKLLQRVQPAKLTDIAATTALHRPGPIESGMMEKFIHRKHGLEAESDIEGELAEILGETYGVIVYGEQIMEIAHRLAGYTYQEADSFRRNLQKGIPEQQKAERPAFLEAAKGNGADQQLAESIHDVMAASAEYTFIKSHAIAQTMLSYRAAYLKAHFPEEFSRAGGGHGLPNGSS
jgi:DNA polymerase-3 subunit alpha